MIQLRKEVAVITEGDYTDLMPEHDRIFCYKRESDSQILLCVNNYYGEDVECDLPEGLDVASGKCLLSNYDESMKAAQDNRFTLKPYETRIIFITK